MFRENARVCHMTVHFDVIADPGVGCALREFLYAPLNFDVPGHRNRLPPAGIRQSFNLHTPFPRFVRRKTRRLAALPSIDQGLAQFLPRSPDE